MEKLLEGYQHSKQNKEDNKIIVPIQYDDTNTEVRAAVADTFSFLLCRPHRLTNQLLSYEERYYPLFLASSNCLVGPTSLFTQFPFREDIPFVYEDLIMTGQMSTAGIQIVCDTRSSVIHSHHHTNKLSSLYINTPSRAYYKAKHRLVLVHTIATSPDLFLFYMMGFL